MTPGEIIRAIDSKNRILKLEAQQKANSDYTLATLIVRGVSITLGDKTPFPSLQEAYPGLFDEIVERQAEEVQQRKTELSTLRFKQFAQSYNDRFTNKEVPK